MGFHCVKATEPLKRDSLLLVTTSVGYQANTFSLQALPLSRYSPEFLLKLYMLSWMETYFKFVVLKLPENAFSTEEKEDIIFLLIPSGETLTHNNSQNI